MRLEGSAKDAASQGSQTTPGRRSGYSQPPRVPTRPASNLRGSGREWYGIVVEAVPVAFGGLGILLKGKAPGRSAGRQGVHKR